MKILLVHNEYGKYSGEEAVVDKMESIFSSLGHEVVRLRMSTAGERESLKGKIHGFVAGIYSPAGVRAMREAIKKHRPDVVNVHNLYPFISPAALRECKKAGVPVVMTIHNFRLICPTGLFMRDGGPCEYCLQKGNEWGCVKYNCEHSMLKSIGYAARNAVARKSRHYLDCVDRFACITDFQRQKLTEAGYPQERLLLIPNPMDLPSEDTDHASAETANKSKGEYVAFCGRISREKGIDLIIEAARRNPDIPFLLAGAVADEELVAELPDNVTLKGYLKGDQLEKFYQDSRFVIMASRCYEGFPMAILEAAKHSKATIGPDHGGFTEIIGKEVASSGEATRYTSGSLEPGQEAHTGTIGALFKPGNADSLSREIRRLWDDPTLAAERGRAAKAKLRSQYSTPVVASLWQSLLTSLTQK